MCLAVCLLGFGQLAEREGRSTGGTHVLQEVRSVAAASAFGKI
jgi:hypothetical protein